MSEQVSDQMKADRLRWIEELESGKWKQALGGFWRRGEEHCCLDVANCLFSENAYKDDNYMYLEDIFKSEVGPRLGINIGLIYKVKGSMPWFTCLNDSNGLSFVEIAAKARELWGLPKEIND